MNDKVENLKGKLIVSCQATAAAHENKARHSRFVQRRLPSRADKIFHRQPTYRFVGLFAGGVRESDRKRILRRKSDMKKTGRF